MHGWGQWYALAAAAVVAGCYLCGARGRTWAVIALFSALEVAAAAAVARTQDTVSWLSDQVVVVLAVFAALAGAYRRLRHEFVEQGWAHARDARLHAVQVLPRREAPVRWGGPSKPGCRFYTDGNYPLAYGN